MTITIPLSPFILHLLSTDLVRWSEWFALLSVAELLFIGAVFLAGRRVKWLMGVADL